MTTAITPTGHTATTTTTTTAPNRTAPTTAPSRTTTTTPTATTTTTNTMSAAGTAQHRTNTNIRNTCSPAHCSRLTVKKEPRQCTNSEEIKTVAQEVGNVPTTYQPNTRDKTRQ